MLPRSDGGNNGRESVLFFVFMFSDGIGYVRFDDMFTFFLSLAAWCNTKINNATKNAWHEPEEAGRDEICGSVDIR